MMRFLVPALLTLVALLQAGCGQPRPSEARKTTPRGPATPAALPSGLPAPVPEASLRLTARLMRYPSRFYPVAGVVHPCPTHPWACVLEADGTVTPAHDYARFANEVDAGGGRIIYHHGLWPQHAWMAARLGPFAGEPEMLDAFLEWTDAGWTRRLEVDGYIHVGMGGWTGDRLIAPIILIRHRTDDRTGDTVNEFYEPPKFVVLSGPQSNDLPQITPDPTFEPKAFASLPSGHAFLVGERFANDRYRTYVQRWNPGDGRSKEDLISNFSVTTPRSNVDGMDPTKILHAFAPDDVYVGGSGSPTGGDLNAAVAHFNGREWRVSFLATSLPTSARAVVTMARGPDGVMWVVCGDPYLAAGELWSKAPGGELEKVELPQAHADGGPIEVVPVDIWPRKASEIWLIAAFRPRGATGYTNFDHGVFVLKPSALDAAPR